MKRMKKVPKNSVASAIVRAVQSPLNERRWLLTLACGHENWVTANAKPKGEYNCTKCKAKAKMESQHASHS